MSTAPNPRETRRPRRADPCTVVIFGAVGDLAKRKLLPALYHLFNEGLFDPASDILGFGRADLDDQSFRQKVRQGFADLKVIHDAQVLENLLGRLHYFRGDLDDDGAYGRLGERLERIEADAGRTPNRLFYLSTLPSYFAPIAKRLGDLGLARQEGRWARVIVEKPFGSSYETARTLNRDLQFHLAETQIYRIDHYLGKETVQNILTLRFGNSIFEPIWNRRYIDHVQITAAETLGVEARGPFYEGAGALRDMVSNHLFQLLALTAMEPPASFDAESVRDEKMKAVAAVKIFKAEQVLSRSVRGQYGPGEFGEKRLKGYRQEDRVSSDSGRETFAALRLSLDNWRWAGVPFYLRTGKRLGSRITEISIQFREPPLLLFQSAGVQSLRPNHLCIRIQPEEAIQLSFGAKVPGPGFRLGDVAMNFDYREAFGEATNTGYESLLYDCMIGDATQFQRADMAEATWKVMDPILHVWEAIRPDDFPNYPAGSAGPAAADELLARDGRAWRSL